MDFDQLLRKYLSGSLTDTELKLFRELLERVPEYKAELRQVLDLRSLIHDDALRLNPPEYLSDYIRDTVGEQFASLPAEPFVEEEKKKRRAIPITWRIAGSTVAASLTVLAIALGPLLREPFNRAPITIPGTTPAIAMVDSDDTRIKRGSAYAIPDIEIAPQSFRAASASDAERTVEHSDDETIATAALQTLRVDDTDAASDDNNAASSFAEVQTPDVDIPSVVVLPTTPSGNIASDLGLLDNSNDNLPFVITSSQKELSENPPATSRPETVNALAYDPVPGSSTMMDAQPEWRKFTVGVAVGSGNVSESNSPTAVMQNSYYLSFGISPNNRVGVEMGGASFMQQKGIATFTNDNLVKPSEGATPTPASGQGQLTIIEKQVEEQITYGAIFYDRKLPLNSSWDLCGRVAVGGADNAVLMNLRAYAAYSPSSNVTLTMGLGGSTLHQFTVRENGNSLNYGVYYGVETGF